MVAEHYGNGKGLGAVRSRAMGPMSFSRLALAAWCAFLILGCTPFLHAGDDMKTIAEPAPCPDRPNCVSSLSPDRGHHVRALAFDSDPGDALERIRAIIASMPGASIVVHEPGYLHAEFRTRLFRFVDDVQFWVDDQHRVIHVRSASRVGYSDLGVNRKRVEEIRSRFGKQ